MKTSPATKAAAISDYLAGNGGYKKIANRYGISTNVLISWIKNQERALSPRNRNGIIYLRKVLMMGTQDYLRGQIWKNLSLRQRMQK